MKLKEHGESTSIIEVTHIDRMGVWILFDSKELYLPFSNLPWFAAAKKGQLKRENSSFNWLTPFRAETNSGH